MADICRRLDGIPLAIELAAARTKMLSPRQLRDRLDERFRVLTGGSRDVLPRQQTLRAMIDWSHELLDGRGRALFRRLGIFASGFAIEGAVAVGSGEDLDELDVFDVLASLVDKSLVLAEPHGEAVRYRLLESTRAYACEKLDAAGERDLVAGRHLRYLRDRFAELWDLRERTARDADLYAALLIELDDVRSALDGALARLQVHRRWGAAREHFCEFGTLPDSTRKASRAAKHIWRRYRRVSRGCARYCQPYCHSYFANLATRFAHLRWPSKRSTKHEQAEMGYRSHGRWASMRILRCSPGCFDDSRTGASEG